MTNQWKEKGHILVTPYTLFILKNSESCKELPQPFSHLFLSLVPKLQINSDPSSPLVFIGLGNRMGHDVQEGTEFSVCIFSLREQYFFFFTSYFYWLQNTCHFLLTSLFLHHQSLINALGKCYIATANAAFPEMA